MINILQNCFSENYLVNNFAITMLTMSYFLICILIEDIWKTHKQDKNYQGLYIGDIIVSIIILPLIIINMIIKLLVKSIEGISELMNIKIK